MRNLPLFCRMFAGVALLAAAAVSCLAGEGKEASFRRNLAEGAELLSEGTRTAQARALARFKTARDEKPESAEAYYWIGLTFSDMGHPDVAATHAEKATLLDRKLAKAWLLWGQSLLHLTKWDEAKEKLEAAHRLDSRNPLISFNLGRCYYHGYSNFNDALYLFKETVNRLGSPERLSRFQPLYVQTKLYMGSCYLAKDVVLAAISSFKDILRIAPENIEAKFRLGVAYRFNQRTADAQEALFDVIAREPRHHEALLQLGHLYVVDQPNERLARYYLEEFLRFAPPDHVWRKRVEGHLKAAQKDARGGQSADGKDGL